MRIINLLLLCLACYYQVTAQPKTDTLLQNLLLKSQSDLVKKIVSQQDTFRLQIIYTQINRDNHNVPSFRNYYLNVDPDLYFNPASMVKLPLTLLALEKLNKKGINKYTFLQIDSSYTGQRKAYHDSSAQYFLPSIAHYIKRALLVSENDPYNRLYQFAGQQHINRTLHDKGYLNTRINRQFMGFSEEQNRHTNAFRFIDKKGQLLYTQPPAYNSDPFDYSRVIKVGRGYYNRNDSLINQPFDFTKTNNVSLEDLQQMLQATMFPTAVPEKKRFNLTKEDYNFLYQFLSQYPAETNYPKYDGTEYYDSYVKFFFKNEAHNMPPHVRVFNKVGWAYGFLIDVSYVVDFKNKIEFMLASTLYVNSDGILNDDRYDYEDVGWPFLYQLGQIVYQYEQQRPRQHAPHLKKFQVKYEVRDPTDTRKTIKNVDN